MTNKNKYQKLISEFLPNHIKQVRTNIGLADTLIPSSFIYLIYMGGTGPCGPMTIIFDSVIKSLHIKFGANCSFHVPKIPVYRFGLYGRYQILWTDIAHFQYQPAYG